MIKVKLDLKFLYWYLSFTGDYFRTHILLSVDASSCYTFSSQEKVSELAGKKLPKRLKRQSLLKSVPQPHHDDVVNLTA